MRAVIWMIRDFSKFIRENIRRWRKDPVAFVREMFQVEPTKQQKSLLMAAAEPGAKVSVRSGHGTGKTACQAWLMLWFLICFTNSKVPCTASSQSQLRDVLWAEISLWHEKMPKWWRNQIVVSGERVTIRGSEATRFAVARTAGKSNPDALQGFHAENILFIIDEASGVFDKVFEVAQGALSTEGARVVMCGNPTQVTGFFYDSHHKSRDSWTRLHFSCLESENVTQKYIEDMIRQYGEDTDVFRVRVEGNFPLAAFNQLIPIDIVEAAFVKTIREGANQRAPKILGVDVAPYGGDRSAIFFRQGTYSKLLFTVIGMDDVTLAGKVIEFWNEYQVDGAFCDRGAGSGVISHCQSLNYPIVGVSFGSSPSKDEYLNKRSEMWDTMKDWLKDGVIEVNEKYQSDLQDDLVGPQYYYNPKGKKQLERKEDMKKRGLASPDLADSLALTFAFPVEPREAYGSAYRDSSGGEAANNEWNPYG